MSHTVLDCNGELGIGNGEWGIGNWEYLTFLSKAVLVIVPDN
ncbi:hypothetical protein [Microcoleus sp. LEGE 07076]|nr:hypothetical protein [Microcoleus sp. LEGE 07076]